MERKNLEKKFSIFQITMLVLIALLVVAIVIEIIYMVVLKKKTNDLKDENDEIVSQLPEDEETTTKNWQKNMLEAINKTN